MAILRPSVYRQHLRLLSYEKTHMPTVVIEKPLDYSVNADGQSLPTTATEKPSAYVLVCDGLTEAVGI